MEPLLQEGLNGFNATGLSYTSIELVGWDFLHGQMSHSRWQVMKTAVELGAGRGLLENILIPGHNLDIPLQGKLN